MIKPLPLPVLGLVTLLGRMNYSDCFFFMMVLFSQRALEVLDR